jgi:hypothetical protein
MSVKNSFMVISPHTKQECLDALDGISYQGKEALSNWGFGCMSGDHTAYGFYEAENEEAARKMIPENVRSKARVLKIDKFTQDQIKSFHLQHA